MLFSGTPCKLCDQDVAPTCTFDSHFARCVFALAPSEQNEYLLTLGSNEPVKCPLCGQELMNLMGLRCHLNAKVCMPVESIK